MRVKIFPFNFRFAFSFFSGGSPPSAGRAIRYNCGSPHFPLLSLTQGFSNNRGHDKMQKREVQILTWLLPLFAFPAKTHDFLKINTNLLISKISNIYLDTLFSTKELNKMLNYITLTPPPRFSCNLKKSRKILFIFNNFTLPSTLFP